MEAIRNVPILPILGAIAGWSTIASIIGGTGWLVYSASSTAEQRRSQMEQAARTEQERQAIAAQASQIRAQMLLEQITPIALVGVPIMVGVGWFLLHKTKQASYESTYAK
jgi:hypothetical protein